MSNVLVSRKVPVQSSLCEGVCEDGCPVEDSGAGTLDTGQHTGPVHSLGGDSLQHTQLTLQQRSLPNHPHISYILVNIGLGVRSFGSSAAAGEKEIVKLCLVKSEVNPKLLSRNSSSCLSYVLMLGMETMILQRSYRL